MFFVLLTKVESFILVMQPIMNKKQKPINKKNGAYIELESDPLWPVLGKVVHLLNNLRSKDQIRASQRNKMMPKREKVALAYLYFISKFLDHLIQPLFDKHFRSTTITDGNNSSKCI